MKRSMILYSVFAVGLYLALGSNSAGPANAGNGNRTGSAVAIGTCGNCHGGGSGTTTLTISLKEKSSGTDANGKYTPGATYTVSLAGNNGSLAKFGFQFTAMKSGNQQAGTFANMASGTHAKTINGISIAEQQQSLAKTNGAFLTTFDWVAPAAGTGKVTFNGIFNAVDGNNQSTGDAVSLPASLELNESTTTGITEVNAQEHFTLYPNPATDMLHVKPANLSNAYSIIITDVTGKTITSISASGNNAISIPVQHLSAGRYLLQLQQNGHTATQQWIKL